MTVKRFRTKIVEIEAMQWRYDQKLLSEMYEFTGGNFRLRGELDNGVPVGEWTAEVFDKLHDTWIGVKDGQWIVRGAVGEFYPCDDETFHWKYEEVKFAEGGYVESGGLVNLSGCVVSPNEIRRRKGMEER